jgi:hypothetical protein
LALARLRQQPKATEQDMFEAHSIAEWFTRSLARANRNQTPYSHWLLEQTLPEEAARSIATLPFAAPIIGDTMGKRETHNSTRNFFSAQNRQAYEVCESVAAAFQSAAVVRRLQDATGAALAGNFLRIEYCQDLDGFWLEPHTDIGAKLFTMLVYLSDQADCEGWGTDIYDGALQHVGAAPGGFDKGLIFIPGTNTWHGVQKRQYAGVRKSIIINYVKPEWRSRHELAFPHEAVRA